MTLENGVTPKSSRYEREFLITKEGDSYKIVPPTAFVYNPMNLRFGAIAPNNNSFSVSVSGYYDVFYMGNLKTLTFWENYLKTSRMLHYYFTIATGSLIEKLRVHFTQFVKIEKSIPCEEEQEKIAKFLSLVDARIEKQRLLVENLKKYKRGLLSQLFEQKIRFKNGNEYYPNWSENKIKNKFKITRGYVLATKDLESSKTTEYCYPVYSSQTKQEGLMGFYNKYLYENAITWTTDGANAGYVKYRNGKFYCTNVCGVLLSENGDANYFVAEKLNSITKKHVSYVGNPKLMNNVMAEINIEFPCKEEQHKLSMLIETIDKNIFKQEHYYEKLLKIKQGLLQQMFI